MKSFYYRYKHKTKKIIGIVLAVIGALIVINIIPIEFLLLLIGLILISLGILIIK
ncbi:hypothetical protein K8M07_01450 [Schnuerera sp. xch1]|uniref:hypothetical protein n=1 Tax=Schnuerera sp. xch1 TaxID=2874283 RepID=UPI001CBD6D73|nr:hypothetical protein [Schnuerera sp. xch1]MBZ2173919.1 hypothetical protein [Schnuerera sp. xch1]